MIYLILLLLTACATAPVTTELNKSWPNEDWQAYAYEKAATLPRTADGVEWCEQGMSQANYTHLLAAVAKHESNFNPSLTYRENFKNGKGEYVISTGLHQVSYESAGGYGFRGVTTEDLKFPLLNIDVAVAILKRWFERDGVISGRKDGQWLGGARYFSVFRYKSDSMKAYLRKYCE